MSYIEQLKESMENGETDHVTSVTERFMIEVGLGSGVRLEVVYFDNERDLDNIQSATLYEHGKPKTLNEEEIKLFADAEII